MKTEIVRTLPIVLYVLGLAVLAALAVSLARRPLQEATARTGRLTPWLLYFAGFALLAAAGITWFYPPPQAKEAAQVAEIAYGLPLLIAFGSLGGVLYGIKTNGSFVLPQPKSGDEGKFELGFLADIAFGVAGALAVFLVIPADIKLYPLEDLVKAMALALIGGYGGPAFLQQVLSKTILRKLEEEVEKRDEQAAKDAKALEFATAHLDGEEKDEEALKQAIKEASDTQRVAIFQAAQDVRRKNWKENKPVMERTLPVFRGLIESKGGSNNHRYYGQLGYALKDKSSPDWTAARESLARAIELRDRQGIKGFPFYDFNFALCEIKLGEPHKKLLDKARFGAIWMALRRGSKSAREDNRKTIEPFVRVHDLSWKDLMLDSPLDAVWDEDRGETPVDES